MKRITFVLALGLVAFISASAGATCVGDFNNDNVVNENDYSIFESQYLVVDCSSPEMPYGCSADLDHDGDVDEDDFYIFYAAYLNGCP